MQISLTFSTTEFTQNFPLDFRFRQVMDAEKQKADSGADHHEKTLVFHAAESKVSPKCELRATS